MNIKWRIILAGVSVALVSGCSARAAATSADAPVPIAIERAQRAQAESIYNGPASVVAAHTYKLAFEVPGRVANVNVDVGDRVEAGAVLATLDDADYRAQVAAAAARAQSASAQARKALTGARPQEKAAAHDAVRAAQAGLDQAVAGLDLAHQNAERARRLFTQGAISAQARDGAVAAERDAQARVDAARAAATASANQAALVDLGPRSEDRSAALAEAGAASASRTLAQIALRKTALRAPAQAYVLQRSIEPGDQAAPGSIVFTLTDAATPDVLVAVPEAKAGEIHPGTTASVHADGRRYAMSVTRVEPQADAVTRTVQVRLHAAGFMLRPGAVVIADIGSRRTLGASVPIGAILTQGGGASAVAIYNPGSKMIASRSVSVRRSLGDRVIVSGVTPGEFIVTGGQYQARPGQSVTVVSQEN